MYVDTNDTYWSASRAKPYACIILPQINMVMCFFFSSSQTLHDILKET